MAPAPEAFGEVLRRLRATAALSQEELAERAGVSVRGISDLERGVRQQPRPETLRLLADALALSPEERGQLVAAAGNHLPKTDPLGASPGIPLPSSPLFGRQEEQATLTAMLLRPDLRLLTVTGPGGAGKTHLALATASTIQPHFRDGALFVDLSPITDAAHVLATISRTLSPDDTSGQPSLARVVAQLRDKHLLLVLDNCEQVLAAAPDLSRVLGACPHLVILATSRAPLGIRGEQEWPLSPLPVPDPAHLPSLADLSHDPAVALFVARAQASAPHFTLTSGNAPAVVAICQQLDGLPLAIELAAARIKLLTPPELAARLQHRLPLLTGGQRDRPPRQQTLRDAIAWSYDLLSPTEQALFRRLGVFVGGCTADAAAAVANLPGGVDILDGLGALLNQSLIRVGQRETTSRYTMLETIREFALDALAESGELEVTQQRHAAQFMSLAEAGTEGRVTLQQTVWRTRLEQELPNLRAALDTLSETGDFLRFMRMTNALAYFWFANAHGAEGSQRLRQVLALETNATLDRARALVDAGMLAYACGEYADASRWFDEAFPILQRHDEPETAAAAWLMRGAVAEHTGDEDSAESSYLSGLAIARKINDARLVGELLPNLSDAAYRRGDLASAEQYALEAQEYLHNTGDAFMESMNLGNLGQVALARGDHTHAAALLAEALDLAEAISSLWNIANLSGFAAAIAVIRGDAELAARLLGAGDAVLAASGHPRMPHFALYAQTTIRVRDTLDPATFQVEWDRGRAIPMPTALQMARSVFAAAREA